MAEDVWFRSHVERLLQEIWDRHELVVDDDGDYPFRVGTAAAWVTVELGSPMAVRVFAHAALGVRRTAKLLTELNSVTARSRFGSVYWSCGVVVCEYALPAEAVDRESLQGICGLVGGQASALGPMLAAVFGGETPFDDELVSGDAEPGRDVA